MIISDPTCGIAIDFLEAVVVTILSGVIILFAWLRRTVEDVICEVNKLIHNHLTLGRSGIMATSG